MRQAFACDAVVVMDPDGDVRAPGAAITAELCGHWEHQPPCPLAAHHIAVQPSGDTVRLRVLFATEPAARTEVLARIQAALARGHLAGPDGTTTRWQLRSAHPSPVRTDETEHAERLLHA